MLTLLIKWPKQLERNYVLKFSLFLKDTTCNLRNFIVKINKSIEYSMDAYEYSVTVSDERGNYKLSGDGIQHQFQNGTIIWSVYYFLHL